MRQGLLVEVHICIFQFNYKWETQKNDKFFKELTISV